RDGEPGGGRGGTVTTAEAEPRTGARWPLDDVFVIDSTIHGYNTLPENYTPGPFIDRVARQLSDTLYAGHSRLIPDGDPRWALPPRQVPSAPFDPVDVAGAAVAFPDLTFEVVHGGMAFLEETAWQIQRFPNVCVNLEGSSAYLLQRAPRKFAELIGSLLQWNG